MQSRDNIHFTCWLDVSLNAFSKLLFDWSERACGKIPTVHPEVNKDRSKMQQTAHCYYGETTARVDSPHLLTTTNLDLTCHAKLSTNTSSSSNAQRSAADYGSWLSPLQGGLGTLVWSALGAHPSAIAAFSPAQTNCTKRENKL